MEPEFLTAKEVAKWLGIVERTVFRLVEKKAFPHYKVGRSTKFRRSDVEAYLASVKRD